MARIEFSTLKESETWIRDVVFKGNRQYMAYFTESNELVLVPTKSTRPFIYGLVKNANKKEVTNLFKDSGIQVYSITNFEWDAERGLSKAE